MFFQSQREKLENRQLWYGTKSTKISFFLYRLIFDRSFWWIFTWTMSGDEKKSCFCWKFVFQVHVFLEEWWTQGWRGLIFSVTEWLVRRYFYLWRFDRRLKAVCWMFLALFCGLKQAYKLKIQHFSENWTFLKFLSRRIMIGFFGTLRISGIKEVKGTLV